MLNFCFSEPQFLGPPTSLKPLQSTVILNKITQKDCSSSSYVKQHFITA